MEHHHVDDAQILKLSWSKTSEGKDSLQYELMKYCYEDDEFDFETKKKDPPAEAKYEGLSAIEVITYKKIPKDSLDSSKKQVLKRISDQPCTIEFSDSKDTKFVFFDITDEVADNSILEAVIALLKSDKELDQGLIKKYEEEIMSHKRGHTEVIIGGGGGS